MRHALDISIDNSTIFNDDFKENIVALSVDQIKNLDIDALQDFIKQKEIEFKEERKEFQTYYDSYSKNMHDIWATNKAENEKKLYAKQREIMNTYREYVDIGQYFIDMPVDFKNSLFLQEQSVVDQYKLIRKGGHFGGNNYRMLNVGAICDASGTTMSIEKLLMKFTGNIDNNFRNDIALYNKLTADKLTFLKNRKMWYIKSFIILKYLSSAAQKHDDAENVVLIEKAIDHVLEIIQKIDDLLFPMSTEVDAKSKDIIETIQ